LPKPLFSVLKDNIVALVTVDAATPVSVEVVGVVSLEVIGDGMDRVGGDSLSDFVEIEVVDLDDL
jgi:hypothetical protein